MKKREITNNDLEQLFIKVIEQAPLISEDQVNSLLNNLPKAPSGSAFKKFFQDYLNSLIFGAIVSSIVVGAILWVNSGDKTEKIISNSQQENKVVPVLTDSLVIKPTVDRGIVQNTPNEDSALKTSSTKIISAPIQTDTKMSVSDIYKHFDKQTQIFSIQTNRDTTIVCKEGTSIKIKANSFTSEKSGKEISGIVQLAVKEYYKISDIILSNLSTTSGDKILETGGMLHITVKAYNENCLIKQGSNIEIGFPYSNKKDNMASFIGEWTNGKMNWKPAGTFTTANSEVPSKLMISDDVVIQTSMPKEDVFVVVEEMPEFPGGVIALKKYIKENTQYPYSALKNKIEGKVYLNFVVDRFGSVNHIRVARGVDDTLDKAAVYLASQMPTWKPGKQRGRAVSVSYTVSVEFALKDSVFTDEEIRQSKAFEGKIKDLKYDPVTRSYITENKFIKEFEKNVKDDNFQKTTVADVDRYVFSASQFGWINCDRFVDINNPKTNYSILIDEPDKTIVSVIFHRFKAIVPGSAKSNRIIFKDVPMGEKITIVALKTVNDKIFLAVKETVITDKEKTDLNFQPVTMELLKKQLEMLNKLN